MKSPDLDKNVQLHLHEKQTQSYLEEKEMTEKEKRKWLDLQEGRGDSLD